MKITVEKKVAAPVEQVWRAYTTPDDIKQWNAASDDWHTTRASVDLREGGVFSSRMEAKDGSMGFDFAGTYTKIVEHKSIEYAFGDRTAQVEFTPDANGVGVRVTFDAETTHSEEQQRAGWQSILNNFARYVEAQAASLSKTKARSNTMTDAGSINHLQPYLFFRGRCEEAIAYYKKALGAEVGMLMRFKDNPDKPPRDKVPAELDDRIMHANVRIAGNELMMSDGMRSGPLDFQCMSLALSVPTEADADRIYNALAAEGTVQMPIGPTFFAKRFGSVADKFGVSWMIMVPQPMQQHS